MLKLLRNLLLLALLIAGSLKLLLWYQVQQRFDQMVTRFAPLVQIRYDNVSADLHGAVHVQTVQVTPQQGKLRGTFIAQNLHIQTPGLLWLLKRSLIDDKEPPDHLSIAIEGLQLPSSNTFFSEIDPAWFNPVSHVPFETLGCGIVTRFDERDYARMGLALARPTQHFDYRYDAKSEKLELNAELDSPPLSNIGLHAELSNINSLVFTNPAATEKVRVARVSLSYSDLGYLQQRNKFCAQHTNLQPYKFVEQHMLAVLEFLKARGIEPGTELIDLYRHLLLNGGKVDFASLPNDAIEPTRFAQLDAADFLRMLNLTARYNDAPPVLIRLSFAQPESTAEPLAADTAASATSSTTETYPIPPTSAAKTSTIDPSASGKSVTPAPTTAKSLTTNASVSPSNATSSSTKPSSSQALPNSSDAGSGLNKTTAVPPIATTSTASSRANSQPPTIAAADPSSKEPSSLLAPIKQPKTQPNSLAASAPPPPPNSTLALVWQDPKIEPLPAPVTRVRDYDIITIESLSSRIGKRIRLITSGGRDIEGHLLGVDAMNVAVRINGVGGNAEFEVPKNRIEEVQLLRRDPPG